MRKEGPGLWAPEGSETISSGPREPGGTLEPLWWAAPSLGKENFGGLPDYRAASPNGSHVEQGVLPVSVTSGKSPDLSGPQYSWEDYLIDLPLPSLRPVAFCLPRPFMGTALISSTALWH